MHLFLAAALLAGPAKAPLDYPIFVSLTPDGTLLVADQGGLDRSRLFALSPDGNLLTLFTGQKEYRTPVHRPRGVAGSLKRLLVCDPSTFDLYQLTEGGRPAPVTGKKVKLLNGRETTMGELIQPEGVVELGDGGAAVTDLKLQQVVRVDLAKRSFAKLADVPAPHGIVRDRDGTLVVVSGGENVLVRVDPKGGAATPIVTGRLPERQFAPFPLSAAVRPDGQYVVTDNYNRALWLVSRDGKPSVLKGGDPFKKVTGVCCAADGTLFVADPGTPCVWRLRPNGALDKVIEKQ